MSGMLSSAAALEALEGHRFYAYRGCAPDPDRPGRMVGNPELALGAHLGPDVDGGEPQKVRAAREAAAVEVCLDCPVMVACDAYASSVRPDGKLAEPDGVWGGRTSLERHRAFIAARSAVVELAPAPDHRFETPQKRAVLDALARCWDPYEVAVAAGMPDVRTANWQRSQLVRLLGLPKDSTRMRVLEVAGGRGLLAGVEVVPDDGSVPAVPRGVVDLLVEVEGQLLLWPLRPSEVQAGVERRRVRRRRLRGLPRPTTRREKFVRVAGQAEIEGPALPGPSDGVLADVRSLFAHAALEAAA